VREKGVETENNDFARETQERRRKKEHGAQERGEAYKIVTTGSKQTEMVAVITQKILYTEIERLSSLT
jgi:hypothetical protein